MKSRSLFLALASFVALACGGGGSGGGLGDLAPSVTIASSVETVEYGQPARLSWELRNVATVEANFPFQNHNSTFNDYLGTETTYTITGRARGEIVAASVTVRVAPSDLRVLLVADASKPSTGTIRDQLQGTSRHAVEVSPNVPANPTAEVIVVADSAAVGPGDSATLRSHVMAGRAVVLVGRAPRRLATGNATNPDVAAIGPWFAGVGRCVGLADEMVEVTDFNPGTFPLSETVWMKPTFPDYGIGPLDDGAVALTAMLDFNFGAFAYDGPGRGKVAYCAGSPVGPTPEDQTLRAVFLSLVRWAAAP